MNGIELQTQREVWLKARAALMERETEAEASRARHQGEIDRAKTRMDSEFEKLQKMVGEVSTTANDYLRPPGQDESLKAADEIARQSPKAVRRVGLADENVFGEAEGGPSADPNAKPAPAAPPAPDAEQDPRADDLGQKTDTPPPKVDPLTDPSFGGPVGEFKAFKSEPPRPTGMFRPRGFA